MRQNWQTFLLALLLAVAAWYMVSGREKVDVWVSLPVELSGMPENLTVLSGLQNRIDVRVRGPKGLIRRLETREFAYSLDVSGLKPGPNVIPIRPETLPMAKTFEVMELNPPRFNLLVDRVVTRSLPVSPRWEDASAPDLELAAVESLPREVALRGPETVLGHIGSVVTETVRVNATVPGLVERTAPLSLPDSLESTQGEVKVAFRYVVKTREMTFTVPVQVEAASEDHVRLRPSKVKIKVAVPLPQARRKDLDALVGARLALDPTLEPGTHELTYRVDLPPGAYLLEAEPKLVRVTLTK